MKYGECEKSQPEERVRVTDRRIVRETQKQTEADRQTGRYINRQKETDIHRETDIERNRQSEMATERELMCDGYSRKQNENIADSRNSMIFVV